MIRIYGTYGPSCRDEQTLQSMFEAGMTGVRLNLSHTKLSAERDSVSRIFRAADRVGLRPELLIDLQGPELRIGNCHEQQINPGDIILLGEGGIPVADAILSRAEVGSEILIDDGKLAFLAEEIRPGCVKMKAQRKGVLKPRKSILLKGIEIDMPVLTREDMENLSAASELGVTGVMQPFVRSAEDLQCVRSAMDAAGGERIQLFAKIEKETAAQRIGELIPYADEIVIARGDLGNTMPLWELPGVQKRVSAVCRKAGKPFMVVTEMLHSMIKSPVPTRAEITDIFNAVLDGAASVMATGETATGEYPIEVIRYLSNTAHEAERFLYYGKCIENDI